MHLKELFICMSFRPYSFKYKYTFISMCIIILTDFTSFTHFYRTVGYILFEPTMSLLLCLLEQHINHNVVEQYDIKLR